MEQIRAERAAAYSQRVMELSLRDILQKKAQETVTPATNEESKLQIENKANLSFYKKLLCERAHPQSSLDDQRRYNIRAREEAMSRCFQTKRQTFQVTALKTADGKDVEVITNGQKSYYSGSEMKKPKLTNDAALTLLPLDQHCFDALKQTVSSNTELSAQGPRIEYHQYKGRLRPFIFWNDAILWCNTAEPFNQTVPVQINAREAGEAVLECTNVFPEVFYEIERGGRQFQQVKGQQEKQQQRIRKNSEQAIARARLETKRQQAVGERNERFVQDQIQRQTRVMAAKHGVSQAREQKIQLASEKQQTEVAERRQLHREALAIEQRRQQQIENRQNQLALQAQELKQRLCERKELEQQARLGARARRMQFMRHREAYKQQKKTEYAEQQQNDLALLETRDNNIKEYERLRNKELLVKYKKA